MLAQAHPCRFIVNPPPHLLLSRISDPDQTGGVPKQNRINQQSHQQIYRLLYKWENVIACIFSPPHPSSVQGCEPCACPLPSPPGNTSLRLDLCGFTEVPINFSRLCVSLLLYWSLRILVIAAEWLNRPTGLSTSGAHGWKKQNRMDRILGVGLEGNITDWTFFCYCLAVSVAHDHKNRLEYPYEWME